MSLICDVSICSRRTPLMNIQAYGHKLGDMFQSALAGPP